MMTEDHIRRALQLLERPARPPAQFAESLFARLVEAVKQEEVRLAPRRPAVKLRLPRLQPRRPVPLFAAALVAVIVAAAVLFFPRPQLALAVIQAAQEQFAAAPPFRAVVSGSSRAIAEEISPGAEAPYLIEQIIWYDGEAAWRRDVVEDESAFRGGAGSFAVWDGKQLGEYLAESNEFFLNPKAPDERIPRTELNALLRIQQFLELLFGPEAEGEAEAFIEDTCAVLPDDQIAGRHARHVSCPETRDAADIVKIPPLDIWVDGEFGLVLKFVSRGSLEAESEVTTIEFNPTFPPGIFEVVPPAGANVVWLGTGPTPPEYREVQPDEAVDATIPVAARPYAVQVGFGSVWVASGSTEPYPTIFRLDPATGETIASVQVNPFQELVLGEGAIWTGWCRVDPATHEVQVIRGLAAGEDVTCEPQPPPATAAEAEAEREVLERAAQVRGYVGAAGEGGLWAAGIYGSAGSVVRLDSRTGELVATIDLGTREVAGAMAVGEGALWVAVQTDAGKSLLYRIDTRSNQVAARIELDLAAGSIAVAEDAVWLTISPYQAGEYDPSLAAVMRVDPRTNRVGAVVVLEGSSDLTLGGGYVWVTNREGNTVTQIDPRTNQVVGEPIVVGGEPASIDMGEGSVWIGNFADGTLSRIDLQAAR